MVITFFSFKGGVGKTTLAIQLARYISEHLNKKVILNREVGIDVDYITNYKSLLEVNEYLTTEIPFISKENNKEIIIWDLKTGFSKITLKILKLSDIILIPFITTEEEEKICYRTINALDKHFKLSLDKIFCVPNRAKPNWIKPNNNLSYLIPINTSIYHENANNRMLSRSALNQVKPTFKNFFLKKT